MKRYFTIIGLLTSLSFQRDVTYRFEALFTMFSIATYMATYIFSLQFTFQKISSVAGYSYEELYTLLLLGQLWWFLNMVFARKNFQNLMKQINSGSLDFLLLKPIRWGWLIPFLEFDWRHVPAALVTLWLILKQYNFELSLFQSINLVFFLTESMVLTFMITKFFTALNFWVGRNTAIFDITIELPFLVGLPAAFYVGFFKFLFLFVVPVVVIANPAFVILSGRPAGWLFLQLTALTLIWTILATLTWKRGLKNYVSAN